MNDPRFFATGSSAIQTQVHRPHQDHQDGDNHVGQATKIKLFDMFIIFSVRPSKTQSIAEIFFFLENGTTDGKKVAFVNQ